MEERTLPWGIRPENIGPSVSFLSLACSSISTVASGPLTDLQTMTADKLQTFQFGSSEKSKFDKQKEEAALKKRVLSRVVMQK
jgi:hypothetical protein